MASGFEINISESDFKSKPQTEQNWILFQGVTAVQHCVNNLDSKGCSWGQNRYRGRWIKLIGAITTGFTVGLGIIYIIYQMVSK